MGFRLPKQVIQLLLKALEAFQTKLEILSQSVAVLSQGLPVGHVKNSYREEPMKQPDQMPNLLDKLF